MGLLQVLAGIKAVNSKIQLLLYVLCPFQTSVFKKLLVLESWPHEDFKNY